MRPGLLTLVGAVFLALLIPSTAAAQEAPDRITTAIVPAARVETNRVHPLATAKADAARVSSMQVYHRMVLLLSGSDEQKGALETLLAEQQDRASANYHKFLSPAEFGARFGPSLHDVEAVRGWLSSQGFQVEPTPNGRRFLLFTGSSAQVESAFQTEMHQYSVNGKSYVANSKPASIPAALASVVKGMAALNSFGKAAPQSRLQKKPQAVVGGFLLVAPADLSAIYDAGPLKTAGIQGEGQSIAVIEQSNINPQDFADFRTLNHLPPGKLNIIVNGPDPGPTGDESEAIIDASWAGALAPNATINFIVSAAAEFTQGIDLSLIYAVDFDVSPITSLSYGGCEALNDVAGGTGLYGALYEQGAAEGISHFVSSGDSGGDTCQFAYPDAGYGVNGLGSSPYNVSVGGTEFIDPNPYAYFPPPAGLATGYIPERAWNDYPEFGFFFPLAGSGGASADFTKPAWQAGPGVPADGRRDLPDVSLLAGAHEAYLVCQRDIGADCSQNFAAGFVGTSISAPSWAGIQALVNQKNAVSALGNPNPTYYRLAAGSNSPFHDITVGDNKTPDFDGSLIGYSTTPGYDLATGLGSVDVNQLATLWSAPTGVGQATVTLTASSAHIIHGNPVTVHVVVAPPSGGAVPSGDISIQAGPQTVARITLDGTGAGDFAFGPAHGSELPGGSYSLAARYAGDANFGVATSNAVAIAVDAEPSTTLITAAPTAFYGSYVSLVAAATGTVSGSGYVAGGTYSFTDNGKLLGTATAPLTGGGFPLASISATLAFSGKTALPVGTHQIIASYAGDANFQASTSSPLTLTVAPGPSLTSILSDHTTPALNTTVKFKGSVLTYYGFFGTPMTGSIAFQDGSTVIGTINLPNAADLFGSYVVNFPYSFTSPGLHRIVAIYSGDANNLGGVSGTLNVTVGGLSSTVTTITGQTLSLAGVPTPITAKVAGDSAGNAPTGNVTFTDTNVASGAGTALGTAPLLNGTATLNLSGLAAGLHFITASYPGDSNYSGSVSTAAKIQTVDFTLTPSSTAASAVAGQVGAGIPMTVSASFDISSIAPGVQFSCSGLPSGAACNFSVNPLLPASGGNPVSSGSTTLTISTTGPTLTKANLVRRSLDGRPLLTMAGLLALGLPLAYRRRRAFSMLLLAALVAFVGAVAGCGGGGGGGGSTGTGYTVTSPGTPAGTSTVTVTATLNAGSVGTLTHTSAVTLTVTSAIGQ